MTCKKKTKALVSWAACMTNFSLKSVILFRGNVCVNVHVCIAFLMHLFLSYCRYSWTLHGVFLCWNILWACSTCQNNRCTVCFWGKPWKHPCLHHISVEHKLYTNQILYFSQDKSLQQRGNLYWMWIFITTFWRTWPLIFTSRTSAV